MASVTEHPEGVNKPWFLCQPRMVLGEGPIYRESDSTLHWNDCLRDPPQMHILHVDADTGSPKGSLRTLVLKDSVTVSFFRRENPGSYICAYYQGVAFLDEVTGELEIVREIIPTSDRDKRRFNDGGIDALGRFWLAEIDIPAIVPLAPGTLPRGYGTPKGRLWRYDPDGSLHLMDSGFVCGNGVAWSPDNKKFYVNDSRMQTVYAYDFDLTTGGISNKSVLIDLKGSVGEPDGIAVDTDGNLWIAMYDKHCVSLYTCRGEHLKDVMLSGQCVTCPTFGGRDRNMLFITTGIIREGALNPDDEGGNMYFHQERGVRGLPIHEFAG